MKPSVIYALVERETSCVRYIGKTVNPYARFKYHLTTSAKSHKRSWLQSINYQVDFVVLEESSLDWVEAECFWIAYFKFIGANLTNMTTGGEGVAGFPRSESTKQKLSASKQGTTLSNAHKQNISMSLLGNKYAKGFKHTEETRAKIGAAQVGRKHSAQTKLKMSLWQVGHTPSKNCRESVAEANRERVFTAEDRAIKSHNMKRIWAERKASKESVCV